MKSTSTKYKKLRFADDIVVTPPNYGQLISPTYDPFNSSSDRDSFHTNDDRVLTSSNKRKQPCTSPNESSGSPVSPSIIVSPTVTPTISPTVSPAYSSSASTADSEESWRGHYDSLMDKITPSGSTIINFLRDNICEYLAEDTAEDMDISPVWNTCLEYTLNIIEYIHK